MRAVVLIIVSIFVVVTIMAVWCFLSDEEYKRKPKEISNDHH